MKRAAVKWKPENRRIDRIAENKRLVCERSTLKAITWRRVSGAVNRNCVSARLKLNGVSDDPAIHANRSSTASARAPSGNSWSTRAVANPAPGARVPRGRNRNHQKYSRPTANPTRYLGSRSRRNRRRVAFASERRDRYNAAAIRYRLP